MDCAQEIRVARLITLWMASIVAVMGFVKSDNPIFQFGPNENLYILNVAIDTPAKYAVVVSVCFVNSGIRTMNHNILAAVDHQCDSRQNQCDTNLIFTIL